MAGPKGAFHENESPKDWESYADFSLSNSASGAVAGIDRTWTATQYLIYGDTAGNDMAGQPIRRHVIEVFFTCTYTESTGLYAWSITFTSIWGTSVVTGAGVLAVSSRIKVTDMALATSLSGVCVYAFGGTAILWDLDFGSGFGNHFTYANPSDSGNYDRRLNVDDRLVSAPTISAAPAACVPCSHTNTLPVHVGSAPTTYEWDLSTSLARGYGERIAGVLVADDIFAPDLAPNSVSCDEEDCADGYSARTAIDSSNCTVTGDFLYKLEILEDTGVIHCVCEELPGHYCERQFYKIEITHRSRSREFRITPKTSDMMPFIIETQTLCDCDEEDTDSPGTEAGITKCEDIATIIKSRLTEWVYTEGHCDVCAFGSGGGDD